MGAASELGDRVAYLPIADRPIIRWPGNARVAFWVSPNITFYEYTPLLDKLRDPYPRTPHPDVRSYAHQDYGKRVGFWRMLRVLDKHGITATASLNVAVLDHFPEIREAMVARDWDYMCHGLYNSRFVWHLSEEEERAYWQALADRVLQHTGKRMGGNLGPGPQSCTERTPDLMAEAGLLYNAAWVHDDQPFPMRVRQGRLISLPYSFDTNDSPFLGMGWEVDEFAEACKRQFDRLYAEGADSGRVMNLSLHTYLIGQPHRIKYLDQILDYILSHDGVWKTTGSEIAHYYLDHYYDATMKRIQGG